MNCAVCQNPEKNIIHEAREQMLGLGDTFEYLECAQCGCVQLTDIPDDMSRFYPENYYSFKQVQPREFNFNAWIKRARLKHQLGDGTSLLTALAHKLYPPKKPIFKWLKETGVKLDSRIIDLGCGSGETLVKLAQEGFRAENLLGVDPFIDENIKYNNGICIVKKELGEVEGLFDLVMAHHSFEHIGNPGQLLKDAAKRLAPGGLILLRIPLAGSVAWQEYGVNWVQLDAPRHLFLHTPKSIDLLCEAAGLKVEKTIYDSTEFQFRGSEAYLKGIALKDIEARRAEFVDETKVATWNQRAAQLNEEGLGDQAGFLIRKS